MEISPFNVIQYKLGIIYARLSHIHLIQMLKILPLKNMCDDIKI